MKLGFYYSLLDWSHPDYPNKTRTEVRYKNDPERWARFNKFNFGQLAELNKTWKPDLYWFDGELGTKCGSLEFQRYCRSAPFG